MPHLLLIMSAIGCGGDDPPDVPAPAGSLPTAAATEGTSVGRRRDAGGPSPARPAEAEDLASSWRPELAAPVAPRADGVCPDADGDGFPDARTCGADPATLDCDDQDATVGPATERWIPAGPFLMGSASTQAGRDEAPVHVVSVSGFCLDVHEARADAVGAWAARAGRPLEGSDLANLDARGEVGIGRGSHPAIGLSWKDARAYCIAQGKALPTEAQWEKAARGGCELGADAGACDPEDLRPYPWGTTAPTCALANHQSGGMSGPPELCVGDSLPVDALPDGRGPYGHHHLAGNAWEWVEDPYHPAVYTTGGRADPGGPVTGPWRGLRGGGWSTFATNMRVANRFQDLVLGSPTGVRCARPTVQSVPDPVEPLSLVTVSGTVTPARGPLIGRALYITAFDAADVDPTTGLLIPGRSPAAERRLEPDGSARQPFTLEVPAGGTYRISAALDGGPGTGPGFVAASGSGGMGEAGQNPVRADADVTGITIRLEAPPRHGPAGSAGPQGPRRPGPTPRGPAAGPGRGGAGR